MANLMRVSFSYDRFFSREQVDNFNRFCIVPGRVLNYEGHGDTGFEPSPEQKERKEVFCFSDSLVAFYEDLVPYFPFTIEEIFHHKSLDSFEIVGERPTTVLNKIINVAMPSNQLMSINYTKAFLNLCSDELTGYLSDGWHIIAVCPQPDQRRPDYVLGRTDGG